jgi:hypothetical protein
MSKYYEIKTMGDYWHPVKILINNNWEKDSYGYKKIYGDLPYEDYNNNSRKYRPIAENIRIKGQNNKFKDSKLTAIKLSKPLTSKGVWIGSGGDEYMYGMYVNKLIGEQVFTKYTELIKMIPLVYGKDEELQGYMIIPYYGFEQNNDLDMNKSDIEYTYEKHKAGEESGNFWRPTYIYLSDKLENKPPIFNYRLHNDDYGLMSSLNYILFNEEVSEELKKVGVKMKPLNMV